MIYLLIGIAVFTLIVVAHLLGWRWLQFKSPAKSLVFILFATLASSWIFIVKIPALEIAYVDMIFTSLTLAYLLTMPAIESDSPSSVILLHIEKCGAGGCTVSDLARVVTDERFVGERIRGMLKQGLIKKNGSDYSITESGKHFLRFFVFYHIAAGRAHVGG